MRGDVLRYVVEWIALMHGIVGIFLRNGEIEWQNVRGPYEYIDTEGLFIGFSFTGKLTRRRASEILSSHLQENAVKWLRNEAGEWLLNLDSLREFVSTWTDVQWMSGTIIVQPEIETERRTVFEKEREETKVRFVLSREEIELAVKTRIFLSHKGVDKPLVRQVYNALTLLGFQPWLDEHDMNAGAELERALLRGMKDSCAAVFFITPDYVDDNFLATEVDYAIAEKRERSKGFSIVTLLLNKSAAKGTVPDLLRKYVWKEPANELEILVEILKAIPLRVGDVRLRNGAT